MPNSKDTTKKIILIIEDETMLTQALSMFLKSKYTVVVAGDGKSGLEAIKKHHPDIVLLDIFLPILNGFTVLEEMKKDAALKNIPVVIMSNCGGESDVKKGLDLGANSYLVKADVELPDIVRKIEELLSKK